MCEGLSKISSIFALHLIKVGKLILFKKVSSDLKTILMHLSIETPTHLPPRAYVELCGGFLWYLKSWLARGGGGFLRICLAYSYGIRGASRDQALFFFPLWPKKPKKKVTPDYLTSRQPHPNLHNLTSPLTCHVISQSAFTRRESDFGENV